MSNLRKCRNCGTPITEKSSTYAIVDRTMKEAKWNFYGGWVCCRTCDVQACLDLKSSMPGAGPAKSLNVSEQRQVNVNWPSTINR